MMDLKFVKENSEAVKANIKHRFMKVDVDKVLRLYAKRSVLIGEADALRKNRNDNAERMKGRLEAEARRALIEEGKQIKEAIALKEGELSSCEEELFKEAARIPNMVHPDVPIGKEEKDNREIKRVGKIPKFAFKPKDHLTLGEGLDLIDFDTASRVAGPKFYYLKNEAVFLELALTRYAMDILSEKGFTPIITPDIAKEEILKGIGFNPRGEESNIYSLEGTGTCLVGTAEITLGGYNAGRTLKEEDLPIRLAGLSHCFRREAGAAGKFSKGLYRVHQFSKVEMFVYCLPEQSSTIHEELREIEEEIFGRLEVPFRVVDTCTGDLGAPAYRKYDLEAWMPGPKTGGRLGRNYLSLELYRLPSPPP